MKLLNSIRPFEHVGKVFRKARVQGDAPLGNACNSVSTLQRSKNTSRGFESRDKPGARKRLVFCVSTNLNPEPVW